MQYKYFSIGDKKSRQYSTQYMLNFVPCLIPNILYILQVANYINGGHYSPHHDYVMKEKYPDHVCVHVVVNFVNVSDLVIHLIFFFTLGNYKKGRFVCG